MGPFVLINSFQSIRMSHCCEMGNPEKTLIACLLHVPLHMYNLSCIYYYKLKYKKLVYCRFKKHLQLVLLATCRATCLATALLLQVATHFTFPLAMQQFCERRYRNLLLEFTHLLEDLFTQQKYERPHIIP